jgi:hypothetical protein
MQVQAQRKGRVRCCKPLPSNSCTAVICGIEQWENNLVVMSCKTSINLIINQNSAHSHQDSDSINRYDAQTRHSKDLVCASDVCLPVHTDPNQFFLWAFCSSGPCSTRGNTDQAVHQNGAAQTTCVATAANKYCTNKQTSISITL